MKTFSQQALIAILCMAIIGNTACTSTQTIHASQQAITASKIHAGDKVTLNYTDGSDERIKVVNIGAEDISGTADDGRMIIANYDDIVSMDHKEVEVIKSAGAAVGLVALGAILVGAAAVGAFASCAAY